MSVDSPSNRSWTSSWSATVEERAMTYEVEIGERGTRVPGKYPKDVSITGLTSAVGIIVYDAESKRSFSIHLTSPDIHETDELDEWLTEPASEFEASESVVVVATGACIGSEL